MVRAARGNPLIEKNRGTGQTLVLSLSLLFPHKPSLKPSPAPRPPLRINPCPTTTQERIKAMKKSIGAKEIGKVTVDMCLGGMRGVPVRRRPSASASGGSSRLLASRARFALSLSRARGLKQNNLLLPPFSDTTNTKQNNPHRASSGRRRCSTRRKGSASAASPSRSSRRRCPRPRPAASPCPRACYGCCSRATCRRPRRRAA